MKEIIKMSLMIKFLIVLIIIGITSTKVDAFMPVTYVCCQNYSLSNGSILNGFEDMSYSGIQLDDFGNMNNWSVGGTGAIQQVDIVNYIYGAQGLKLTGTNGNRAYIDKVINNNFSNSNNFVVWAYVYNINTIKSISMYLTSNGSNWNTYFVQYMTNTSLQQGWNKLIFNKGDFTSSSIPESWNNVMNKIRLAICPVSSDCWTAQTSGVNASVTFDNLRYNMNNDWTVGGSGAFMQPDKTNFVEGQQGLKLTISSGTGYIDLPINNNFSTTNNFAIWAYVDNANNFNGTQLYISSNASNFNTYFYDAVWSPAVIKTGWNHLIFNKHNFVNVGGENWNNVMKKIRLRTYAPNNIVLNVTFDYLTYNISGQRSKIMFNFDDGTISQYQKAYPVLNYNNQSAVEYVVINWLDPDGVINVNLSELKTMQSSGWDISSHTLHHYDLRTLNDSSLISELNDSYTWLVSNGFQKSAGFLAYPYGYFNDNVINKTISRYIFGRGSIPEASQQFTTTSDNTIQYIQRYIVTSNTSTQSIIDQLNDSINANLLSIVTFHKINDTNPTNDLYTFLTSDLQNISNYIKSRNDTDVITYSDNYVIPIINNFTPVINKITRIYSNGSSILITKNKYDEYMPNMTVIPSSDSIDINITSYDQTGGSIKFNESSPNGTVQVSYNIGDRTPNWLYTVNVFWSNGSLYQSFNSYSNNSGYIDYNLTGFQDSRYQDIEPKGIDTSFTITVPAGYANLRFYSPSSTVSNLNPDGQTSSQPFFNILNTGNVNQNFIFYLDSIPNNINIYTDLNNDFSTGRIIIKPSISTLTVPNLGPGNNQNIWIVMDANQASPTNMNSSLTLNSVSQIPGYVSNNCDPSLWNYVWGENQNLTYRLILNKTYSCINVAGTVNGIAGEADGDFHAILYLDPQYSSLGSEIQFEIVCANSNKINETVCNNFNQSYLMNNISNGVHISITGAYVTDVGWDGSEVHPVTSVGPVILSKVANRRNYQNVGDIIQYNYNITNIGNDMLSGFNIIDNKTGIIPCPGNLFPGQSIQCTSNYTITQSDINNRTITNNAYISIVSNGNIINSNLVSTTVYRQ